jgi:hypothetical protein
MKKLLLLLILPMLLLLEDCTPKRYRQLNTGRSHHTRSNHRRH